MSSNKQYQYLPVLTMMLLLAIAGLAIRLYITRPPADMRRKIASFQSALELIPQHYEGADQERLFHAAMQGMIESLDDPYSRYLTPTHFEEVDAEVEGTYGGVGIQISPLNEKAVVTALVPGGAAEEKELKAGYLILGVNGQSVSEMDFQQLVSAIRGRPGTKVQLLTKNPETGEETELKLERRLLEIAPVEFEVRERIGILTLSSFNARSAAAVKKTLESASEKSEFDGLILDLRGNPGGLLEAAVEVADMLLKEGRIAALKSTFKAPLEEFHATPSVVIDEEMPMAVLVDEGSASASELLAGALQSHGRATVIGTRTVGKGAVDSLFSLPDGSGLVLKVAGYTAGADIKIEGKGIEPDILTGEIPEPLDDPEAEQIKQWISQYRQSKSEQMNRAFEYLKGKTAAED